MQTKAFYYWIAAHQDELERLDDRYRVTKGQLAEFAQTLAILLKNREPEEALAELPPYPAGDIDDAYWEDLQLTNKILSGLLTEYEHLPDTATFYYTGTMPVDNR